MSLARRTRIKPVSDKRAARRNDRERVRQHVIERDHGCRAAGQLPGVCGGRIDPHEPKRGADRLDVDQVIALCRHHHDWVHGHPAESYERGYLVHFWEEFHVER